MRPVNNVPALLRFAREAVEAGYSLIPIDGKTKRPHFRGDLLPLLYDDLGKPVMRDWTDPSTGEIKTFHARGWKPFQTQRATLEQVEGWIRRGAQLAVVGGAVSGGLLIIDFDSPGFFFRWMRACKRAGYDLSSLPIQRTGGGGWQVVLNCNSPGENQKLAWTKDDTQKSGRSVAIETRAEGGYAVVAPSLHPSGNFYVWRRHTLADAPHVDQADADALLAIARTLNEGDPEPPKQIVMRSAAPYGGGESVIDAYNKTDIVEALLLVGYTPAGNRLHRPGRERNSQPSVHIDREKNRSFHHSSNDELSSGYWVTPFEVRCRLEFDGDVCRAVRAIAAELGMQLVRPISPTRSVFQTFQKAHSFAA